MQQIAEMTDQQLLNVREEMRERCRLNKQDGEAWGFRFEIIKEMVYRRTLGHVKIGSGGMTDGHEEVQR